SPGFPLQAAGSRTRYPNPLAPSEYPLLPLFTVVAARAPRKVLGSSTSATNSTPVSSRKAENKYAGGNPVCVRPTPKWQKGIGEFFRLSSKDSEKENQIPEEAGSSGLGKAKRKECPLQPDHTNDEKNENFLIHLK
uniref:PCNA-associated factor n=1 Tax=Macaca fascicularis TaxID=9541 RepID=A0A7N9I9Q9_MACFA